MAGILSVAMGAFESILFAFTLVKFVKAVYEGWGQVHLLTIVFRDGTWAFALITGMSGHTFPARATLAYGPWLMHHAVALVVNGVFFGLDGPMAAVGYQCAVTPSPFPPCQHQLQHRWLLTTESFAGYRIILNLLKSQPAQQPETTHGLAPPLTTVFAYTVDVVLDWSRGLLGSGSAHRRTGPGESDTIIEMAPTAAGMEDVTV
jgi:hypothetical protein